jgi:hypothetical protein
MEENSTKMMDKINFISPKFVRKSRYYTLFYRYHYYYPALPLDHPFSARSSPVSTEGH